MYRVKDDLVIDLLHPDLLSTSILETLLKERKIDEEHLKKTTREQLLSLYFKVVLPLPQREFRKNRRGSYISKKFGASALQEKSTESELKVMTKTSDAPCSELHTRLKPPPATMNKTIGLHSTEPQSRLKPPPISTESGKVIKLKSPPGSTVSGKNLNSRTMNGDSITPSKRSVSPPVDSKKPKLIRLNRTAPPPNSKSKDGTGISDETTVKEESGPPKKKHKPILWP